MRILLGTILALGLSAACAQAQSDFPTRPVTLVVPLAAGGPSDAYTRVLAEELSKVWKQQVVVENKAGGGTLIANSYVANAKPDGYTLLVVSGSFTILPATRSNLPYDTLKHFSGVTIFVEGLHALVASPNFGPNSLSELVAEAKKRPDRPITFAGAGTGSTGHMLGELIANRTGAPLKHVAYSGEAGAIPDLMAGRIDFQIATWATVKPLVDSKKLKVVAILDRARLPELPDVQAVVEVVPELSSSVGNFNGIVVPAAVPADVKARIAEGMRQATQSPAFIERMQKLGASPRSRSPAETDEYLQKAVRLWTEVAKSANIRLD